MPSAFPVVALLLVLFSHPVLGAGGSSSCSGSGSGSGSAADCPTPAPQSHLQTILTWDCNGRVRFLPDNPLFNINIDIPMLPRMFYAGLEGIEVYLKAHCEAMKDSFNHQELRERYHPLFAILYGNELYKGTEATKLNCLDFTKGFTRDLRKLYADLTGKTSFEMPQSCQKDYPKQCSFTHPIMEIGADLQIVAQQCAPRGEFYQVSIGCEGGGCNIFKPCHEEADCASLDHLTCVNPFQWVDPKLTEDLKNAEPKFTESDVYEVLRDTFKYYDPSQTFAADPCGGEGTKYTPKKLFKKFLEKFSKYIVGSPESNKYTTSTSCLNGECTICLPVHTNAFGAIFGEFSGRWEEITDEYPVNREQIPDDECSVTPTALVSNYSALRSSRIPAIFTANTSGGILNLESPLSRGSKIPILNNIRQIGGGLCTDDSQCLPGICITQQQFCEKAVLECDMHSLQCEYDVLNKSCSALANANQVKNCTCPTFQTVGSATQLIYGEKCENKVFIPKIEESMLKNAYTFQKHKWKSLYDPFVFWNGEMAADGEDPFTVRDHWPKFPKLKAPIDEVHIASLQCDNVLQFFQGTDFAIRIHAPYADQLLEFFGKNNYATWECRRSNAPGANPYPKDSFLISQAVWRPEPWLYAKTWEDKVAYYPDEALGNSNLLNDVFPYKAGFNTSNSTSFEIFNSWQVTNFGSDHTLGSWINNKYLRLGYVGFAKNGVFGSDSSINFRMKECADSVYSYATFDLTCEGKGCKEMQLGNICEALVDCKGTGFECQSPFEDVYNEDIIRQMLWGVDRTGVPTAEQAEEGMCPSLESFGKHGRPTELMKGPAANLEAPIRQTVQKMWLAMKFPDCSHKEGGPDCWGHCVTYENDHCTYLTGFEPPAIDPKKSNELKFCMPNVYPPYKSLVTDLGYSDPLMSGDKGWYSNSIEQTHIPVVDVEKFGISPHVKKIEKPIGYWTESVDPPVKVKAGTTFGKSFIAVMLCMALIVCVSSLCVYYHYVRISKSEYERQQSLHGLTFAYDTEKVNYGRDLMIPDMAKRWLPGEGGAVALKKSAVVEDDESDRSTAEEMAMVAPVPDIPQDDDAMDSNSHVNGWSSQDGKSVRSFKKSITGRGASDSLSLPGSEISEQNTPIMAPRPAKTTSSNNNGNNNNDWVSSVAPGYAKLLADREKKYNRSSSGPAPVPHNLPIDNDVPLAPPPPGTRPMSLGGSARSGSTPPYSSPYASGSANNSFPTNGDRDLLLQDFTSKPSKPNRRKY